MQTKSSYRVLKWAFLGGMAMSLATACVVSSGDGDDDDTDLTDGGDGGTNTSSAGKSTGGGGSNGGSSAGSKATGGSTDDGGEPAMTNGGTPSTFVGGECQDGEETLTPANEPGCDAADGDSACITCLKLQACDAYNVCFGTNPTTACSLGQTEGADGQFNCITKCFADGAAAANDADQLLAMCAGQCNECPGELNQETNDLIGEANDPAKCQAECFPFE